MARQPYKFFEPDKANRLKNLDLQVRRAVEGFITGMHKSPHRGFSIEFSEHRDYAPGDDTRHLDWGAWARSDRYYIKQYEQETNLRATILLDVSGSMGFRHDGAMSKFEYGGYLAACLSYLMGRQQDAVGMVAFDEKIRFNLPCGSTPAHLDRIFHHLEDLQPGGQTALGETFHQLADRLPRRGLVIIISDLYDEPQDVMRALQHFVYKRHQIMVFHLMDPAERTFPFTQRIALTDMETRQRVSVDPAEIREEYCRRVQEYIDAYRRQCAQRDIEYRLAETDTPYEHLLREYLTRRKALLK